MSLTALQYKIGVPNDLDATSVSETKGNASSVDDILTNPLEEISATTLKTHKASRSNSLLPLCISRSQQETLLLSEHSNTISLLLEDDSERDKGGTRLLNATVPPRRRSLSALSASTTAPGGRGREIPYNWSHALQMVKTYPIMKVTGTAFENALGTALRRRMSRTDSEFSRLSSNQGSAVAPERATKASLSTNPNSLGHLTTMQSSTSSMPFIFPDESEPSVERERRLDDKPVDRGVGCPSLFNLKLKTSKLATFLKCAMMWRTLLVLMLSTDEMINLYRESRLRTVLEKKMLPVLLYRKEKYKHILGRLEEEQHSPGFSKSIVRLRRQSIAQDSNAESDIVHVNYLAEYCPFLASLSSPALLQELTLRISRVRYMPGEIIAHSGDPSQTKLYFLISGRCHYLEKTSTEGGCGDHKKKTPDDTPSNNESMHTNAHAAKDKPTFIKNRTPYKVLLSKETFGGVFQSSATFAGTYKATSQCIIWILSAEDFEATFLKHMNYKMLQTYFEASKKHHMELLRENYPIQTCIHNVPIYRHLIHSNSYPASRYVDDFEPVVMVRGQVLFEQGQRPGDVYCLVDGAVRRTIKGSDGSYENGAYQTLKLNKFYALKIKGRYALLGEEPYILPGVQRYQCAVSSRCALFFRIPGEKFINAILDSPLLFGNLRTKLTEQIKNNMRLDPMCLRFAPLLSEFPENAIHALAKAAEPRVFGRSASLCESSQFVKEIYLVMSTELRDPRSYSRVPTMPLATLPPLRTTEGEKPKEDALSFSSGTWTVHREEPNKTPKTKNQQLMLTDWTTIPCTTTSKNSIFGVSQLGQSGNSNYRRQTMDPKQEEPPCFTFVDEEESETLDHSRSIAGKSLGAPPSKVAANGGAAALRPTIVTLDEEQELNPPLPLLRAKHFLATVGGGWEGLLMTKWPIGWEAKTTVEAWAIPTLRIRIEFKNSPKSVQSAILLAARTQQKIDLGLSELPLNMLQPASAYYPSLVDKASSEVVKVNDSPGAQGRKALTSRTTKNPLRKHVHKSGVMISGRPVQLSDSDRAGSGLSGVRHTKKRTASGRKTFSSPLDEHGSSESASTQEDSLHNQMATHGIASFAPCGSGSLESQPDSTHANKDIGPRNLSSIKASPPDVANKQPKNFRVGTSRRESSLRSQRDSFKPHRKGKVGDAPTTNPPQASLTLPHTLSLYSHFMLSNMTLHPPKALHEATSPVSGGQPGAAEVVDHAVAGISAVADGPESTRRRPTRPSPRKGKAAKTSRTGLGGADSEPSATAPIPATAWPTTSAAPNHDWFNVVPSYMPLPGTHAPSSVVPKGGSTTPRSRSRHAPFPTLLDRKNHTQVLESQAKFFSSTNTLQRSGAVDEKNGGSYQSKSLENILRTGTSIAPPIPRRLVPVEWHK